MKLIAKIRKRAEEGKTKSIERLLQVPGKILVRQGERVRSSDVIAEGTVSPGFRSLPLAEILGVKTKEAARFLLKKEGEKIRPGEIIAIKKNFFGLIKKTVTSPIEGTISSYDTESGILRLDFLPQVQRLVAACDGEVKDVPDRKTVILSCFVSEIYGVLGSGRTREGVLKVLAQKDDFLLPTMIDESCSGAIIVGGALVSRPALTKAMTVGVSGIIAGGIHARDFFEIGGASSSPFWASSDIGLTLILTEGFGRRTMSDDIFSILEKNNNKFVLIDGDRAVLTIPDASVTKQIRHGKRFQEKVEEQDEREIKIGDRVRVIDYDLLGLEGVVKSIDQKEKTILEGLKTYMIEIETKRGRINLPYKNIEIVD